MKNWRGKSGLVTRLGHVPLACVLALGAAAPLASCSSEQAGNGDAEDTGRLDLKLEAGDGITLNSVSYTISGNGFSKSGSIDTSGAPTVTGTIGGIPAGKGYTIALTATSTDGNVTFTGSAKFNVSAGASTSVSVHLTAKGKKSGNGSVSVNASLNVGPVIDELSVSPLTVLTGSSITLNAVGSDADEGPSPLTYYWGSTGGTVSDPISPNATLTSATPGTFTVTLTISDGEITSDQTATVTFVEPETDADGGVGGGGGPENPNILVIVADDWGADGNSLYPEINGDSGAVPVPNVEALAARGLVFDNAWSSPACSMTRSTIVTGQYGYRTGVTSVGAVLPTNTPTVFDRITADSPADYGQAFFGKYHLGGGLFDPRAGGAFADAPKILQHVRDLGIPTFKGILGGAVTDYFSWNAYDINAPATEQKTYATTVLTDFAIDYINTHETNKPNDPWFIYQAYNAPHAANGGNNPYQVPPPELHSVDLSSVGNPQPGTSATNIPIYKANIQALDTEIGRLLKEVDFEKTTVILVGDNGTPPPVKDTGTGVRGAKGSVYEGGVRVPFIVAGAGVTRRGREDALVVTSDIYATVLSLAGLNVSHEANGYSIEPLLSDATATSGRTHSFTESSSGTNNRRWALKDTRFKLVNELGTWALYDLVADPLETTNLYKDASYAAVLATLQAQVALLKADAAPGYFP